MKIVFFGTSDFALVILRRLLDSEHKVLTVVTQPDRQKGRSLKVTPSPVKALAAAKGIPVYQPVDASGRDSVAYLKKFGADLFVVVAFGQILKKDILDIPRIYSVNVHGSLLPKYRGAAPTNWAIINGDETTGITVIKMNEKMDEGDIILTKEIPVDREDTNVTLSEKLSDLGADTLIEALGSISSGSARLIRQDSSVATYAPKLKKEDGLVDWNESAAKIHNKVRGFLPWPSGYTYFGKKILKILNTELFDASDAGARPGEVTEILKHKGIVVKTGKGSILVKYVQIEAKRPFDTDAFLCGHKLSKGYVFGR
jgi:methionyl-tRNA formyltransferase